MRSSPSVLLSTSNTKDNWNSVTLRNLTKGGMILYLFRSIVLFVQAKRTFVHPICIR